MKILYVCSDPSIRPGGRGGGFTTHMEEMIESFRKLGNEVVVVDTKTAHNVTAPRAGKSTTRDETAPRAGKPVTRDETAPRAGKPVTRDDETASGAGKPHGERDRVAPRVPRRLRVILRDLFYLIYNAGFYFRMAAFLKERHDFDFVYERHYLYQFAASSAARKRKLPMILEFNASIDETRLTDGLGLRPLAAFIERMVTRRAGAVITVSAVLKNYLVHGGLAPDKIVVMHNGVNVSKFNPEIPGDAIRGRFGLSPEDVVVGFVGGFSVWHGAHLLLDVASFAVKEDKRIRFLMVGGREGNPRFESFKNAVLERGLTAAFRFAGEVPRERVPEHIAAFDIAVIPWATDYGSPTKTFEYMGMAKALVAPGVAALEEVLTREKTALLVAVGDVQEMAKAILRLASDKTLRETLGQNARRAVEEKYNWDRNAALVIEIAKKLAAGKR